MLWVNAHDFLEGIVLRTRYIRLHFGTSSYPNLDPGSNSPLDDSQFKFDASVWEPPPLFCDCFLVGSP